MTNEYAPDFTLYIDTEMAAPHIESYHFGQITIDGQSHDRDVIILPDRVIGGWWRQEGHALHPADLDAVFETRPEVLVVGQGAYGMGMMRVTDETRQALQAAGIELVAQSTEQACQTFNSLRETRATAAALHLAC